MLGQKEGLGRVMAQKLQKQTYPGLTPGSLKEKNNSNDCQTNTSIMGYMKMPGESAWSQHSDSAASMFPLAPGWEEDYQDLSPYCQESLQNMPFAKEEGIKSFSSIVQDDELNTPEICISSFDYPIRRTVSDDTSPVSLFDGGMWDIPPPIVSRQISNSGKVHDIIISESEKCLQTPKDIESDHFKSDVGNFDNGMCIPIVSHEEEITSTEDIIIQESVTHDMETNSLIVYDKETESVQIVHSVDIDNINEVKMIDPVTEVEVRAMSDLEANWRKIESLLDDSTIAVSNLPTENTIAVSNLPSEDENYFMKVINNDDNSKNTTSPIKKDVTSDLDFSLENQEFNSLMISNTFHEEDKTEKEINAAKKHFNERRKFVTNQINTGNPTRSDTVQIPIHNVEKQCRQRSELNLNLAVALGAEDMISTPVILESLLGGEEVPFENLLEFIQQDIQDVKVEPLETTSTVDFSEVSGVPSIYSSDNKTNNEIIEETSPSVMTVQPVVIKKSRDGKLIVSQKQVLNKKMKTEGGNRSGKRTLSKKGFAKMSKEMKTVLKTEIVDRNDLAEEEDEPLITQKRKRPRGRPRQEQSISTSRPSRQRNVSHSSQFDDIDSPPTKRLRQSSVESESDKYRELRDRNNEASRKSRLSRKSREADMKKTAERLEKENQTLRIKAEEMERLVKKLRQALLEVVTKGRQNN